MKWILLFIILAVIVHYFRERESKFFLVLSVLFNNLKIQTMNLTGQSGNSFKFVIDPAKLDGTILPRSYNDGTARIDITTLKVTSSDPTLCTIAIDPEGDGYSGSGNLVTAGTGTIDFSATNSKGTTVTGSASFTITAVEEDAAALQITFS